MTSEERADGAFDAIPPVSASESDERFAERFVELAALVASCRRRGRISLLLSTCRNQWMTINAAFFDIREVLVARQAPDAATEALEQLKFARFRRASRVANRGLMMLGQAREKFEVWEQRESLREEFEAALHALPEGFSKQRIKRWYDAQSTGRARGVEPAQTKYMALDLRGDPEANGFLELLDDAERRLRVVFNLVTHAARLLESESEPESELEPDMRLFEAEEERDPTTGTRGGDGSQGHAGGDPQDTWRRLVRLLAAESSALGATWDQSTDEGTRLVFSDAAAIPLPDALPAAAEVQAIIDDLRQHALDTVTEVGKELAASFRPNVAQKPLPEPFVLDLRPRPIGTHTPRKFKIASYQGVHEHVPDTARIAILDVDIPEAAYSRDDSLYIYEHGEPVMHARELALAAVTRAHAEGAAALVMPEVFIPRANRREVFDAARESDLMLIGGLDYPVRIGRAINETAIVATGLGKEVFQRKQRPSVYELRPNLYEPDGRLVVVEHSPIGTFATVVCSDYLELDLLWALASQPARLDVVVVCSRNPVPAPFARLAEADAVRLHAYVIVVNSISNQRSDERTSFICAPGVHSSAVDVTAHELPTRSEIMRRPELLVADLDLRELRSLDSGRGGRRFLAPPHFPRRTLPTDPVVGDDRDAE